MEGARTPGPAATSLLTTVADFVWARSSMPFLLMIFGLIGFAAMIVAFVGFIMVVVAAFRESPMWGLGVLFVPLVILIYAIMFWEDAKKGFLLYIGGVGAIFAIGVFSAVAIPAMMPSEMEFEEWDAADAEQWEDWQEEETDTFEPRPTRVPPTPVPTPTPYIPKLLPTSTPSTERFVVARPTVWVLTVDNAEQRVGWMLEIVTTDGRAFEGTLIAVDDELLQFEQRVGGGAVIFPVRKDEVASIRETN
jgi:hypothetical protein